MLLVALAIFIFADVDANALIYAAKEMENPGRNIPIAFVVSNSITGIPFAIMAYIWAAVMPRVLFC